MKEATDFLSSLARCVSTATLYEDGHPSRRRAVESALEHLRRFQEIAPTPRFTFLVGEVLHDARPLRALRHWDWGDRMSRLGVQRLEFTGPVTREDFETFLEEIESRLTSGTVSEGAESPGRVTSIRWGPVDVTGRDQESDVQQEPESVVRTDLRYGLGEEIRAVRWIHEKLGQGEPLPMLEVQAVVRSLGVAMHEGPETVVPLVRAVDPEFYPATHAINVAVLTMSLADFIGLGPHRIRALGVAGLLHDVGMLKMPGNISTRSGPLSAEEHRRMTTHPAEGARMLLERSRGHLDLAAVVAWEHHLRADGGGYPDEARGVRPHPASHLVHVCDVFDALRSRRPYREAWSTREALDYLEAGSGSEFDPDFARAFGRMVDTRTDRIVEFSLEADFPDRT